MVAHGEDNILVTSCHDCISTVTILFPCLRSDSFVPPLQLVSAALWEILKQGAVKYYDLLEEFVATVLETVPELLTYTERIQLVMGLCARVVLELCRSDFAHPPTIQCHLTKINGYITEQDTEMSRLEAEASITNFLKLVRTLVGDKYQRATFFSENLPNSVWP
ncbi:uncharacterized protein PAE49_016159 isoform 2-T2 [Odontesthes bonariensis]